MWSGAGGWSRVWVGLVWSDAAWRGVLWCNVVRCSAMRCGAMRCGVRWDGVARAVGTVGCGEWGEGGELGQGNELGRRLVALLSRAYPGGFPRVLISSLPLSLQEGVKDTSFACGEIDT